MVSLNATLLVQLVLFIGFLWLVNTLVFKRVLRVLDERDDQLDRDKAAADQKRAQAGELERRYVEAISDVRRETLARMRGAQREAFAKRTEAIVKRQQEDDAAVERVAEAMRAKAEAQRGQFDHLAADLSGAVIAQLGTTTAGGAQR